MSTISSAPFTLNLDHAAAGRRLDDALLEIEVELLELLLHVLERLAVFAHSAGWEHSVVLSIRLFDAHDLQTRRTLPGSFFTPGSAVVSAGRFGAAAGAVSPIGSDSTVIYSRPAARLKMACTASSIDFLFLGSWRRATLNLNPEGMTSAKLVSRETDGPWRS